MLREPGVRVESNGPQLMGSRWHWFQMKRQDCPLSAESKQGQQGHGEAEKEAIRARVAAAVNVPQHGLQGTQSQWQGECQPRSRLTQLPAVSSSWMPGPRTAILGSGEHPHSKRDQCSMSHVGTHPSDGALGWSPQLSSSCFSSCSWGVARTPGRE